MKESHFIIIWLSFIISTFSQEIEGQVVSKNGDPIPSAHIYFDESLGTISNNGGYFRLFLPKENDGDTYFKISCIGYKPKIVLVENGYKKIVLEEDPVVLDEVEVISKDYAKEIIEKSISAIPNNYPLVEERHVGFLREQMNWIGSEEGPIYIAESTIESIKKSYENKQKSGVVTISKFRKFESEQLDTLPLRIYGGPHHIHRFDIVASRKEFLSNPDAFEYEILDTLRFENRNVFKIYFEQKKLTGYVYIMDSSFAISKAEFKYHGFSPFDIKNQSREYLNFSVTYELNNKIWRFKQSSYNTGFQRKGRLLELQSEYASTEIRPNLEDIPYNKRLDYSEVLLKNSQNYDSAFWKNYNIILPDSTTEALFKKQGNDPTDKKEKKLRIFDILDRMRTSLALDYSPLAQKAHNISFLNQQFTINESLEAGELNAINLSSTIQYEWKKSLFVGLNTTMTLSNPSNSTIDLQFLREINLNPKRRPIYLTPGLAVGYQQISNDIGNFQSESNFYVNGKKFDSGSTDISLQQRGFRLLPSLSLGVEKSHQLQFFISAGYNISIVQKTGLYFDETDQFFLKQKSTFLKDGQEALDIPSEGQLFTIDWTFSMGVYLSF